MYTVIWCLRRKPGITFEQFRDHYENSHAVLGAKYFGHLMSRYTRNYNLCRAEGAGGGFATLDYDCVTEWVMHDEAAFDESMRILADPVIGKIFHDDEEHFLHRESVVLVRCDSRESASGGGMPAATISKRS